MKNYLSSFLNALFWLALCLASSATSLAEIRLNGVANSIKQKLQGHLSSIEVPCDLTDNRQKIAAKIVGKELQIALNALGYFNAKWELEFLPNGKCWNTIITVDLGKAVVIRTAEIQILGEAGTKSGFTSLLTASGLIPGSAFDSAQYEKVKEVIQAQGLRQGYFDAEFNAQTVAIYPGENAVDIRLIWNSGRRYKVGDISINQPVLNTKLFEDLVSFKQGDNYDLGTIQSDRLRLTETNYFKSVEIKPLIEQRHDNQVDITITGTEGRNHHYQAGIGFSTNTGPRLRGDFSHNRINNRGHSGSIKLLISNVLKTANANYTIPWRDPRTDSLRGDISFVDEDNDTYSSERLETSIASNIRSDRGWRQSLSATYSAERSRIANVADQSKHLVPAISLAKLSADDLIHPTRGYSISLTLSGTLEGALSDSSFAQVNANLKWVTSLPYQFRLLARSELGFSLADDIKDIPVSRRFFTGGDNSIRGYEYQSLGPKEGGEVIGGRHLATGSIELVRPVYKKWSVAVFSDIGNAWDRRRIDAARSVGLGIRWQSPIGPLRLDLAHPLDDQHQDFRIHFSLGPEL